MASAAIRSTTQLFTEIHDITSNILIMNDGSAAVILKVSAMNFGLLAEEEQDGVIYGYAALLNSLNYPIQIVIQSQTKDVTNYLKLLKHQEEKTKDHHKKQLIAEYRQFVAELIKERNVLDKKFFVVIPANSLELGLISPSTFIPGIKKTSVIKFELASLLEKAKTILEPKRDHLIALFARIGLSCKQLNTQEIVRVFYNSYNQESSKGQLIADTASYTTPIVKAKYYQAVPKTKKTLQKNISLNSSPQTNIEKKASETQEEKTTTPSTQVAENQTQQPPLKNDAEKQTKNSATTQEESLVQPIPLPLPLEKNNVDKGQVKQQSQANNSSNNDQLLPLPEIFGDQ